MAELGGPRDRADGRARLVPLCTSRRAARPLRCTRTEDDALRARAPRPQVCFFAQSREEGAWPPQAPAVNHPMLICMFSCAPCAAGTSETQLQLPDGADTESLRAALTSRFPSLEAILPRCALACNGGTAPSTFRTYDSPATPCRARSCARRTRGGRASARGRRRALGSPARVGRMTPGRRHARRIGRSDDMDKSVLAATADRARG